MQVLAEECCDISRYVMNSINGLLTDINECMYTFNGKEKKIY